MISKGTIAVILAASICIGIGDQGYPQGKKRTVSLPEPIISEDGMSVSEALNRRQCIRLFSTTTVTLEQLSQLLWSGNGQKVATPSVDAVSAASRTAPSAGGLYPIELYVVVGEVKGLKAGVYHYRSTLHSLELIQEGDIRAELSRAALGQRFIETALLTVAVTAVYERTTRKYGNRGTERYVEMDAGHTAENIFLQATALDLGTTTVGAFRDVQVEQLLGLTEEQPLYLMPIGVPAE